MLFKKETCAKSTIRTQNDEKSADCWETVFGCLETLFKDPDEFVVLTLADSDVKHGVHYIQSAWTADGLTVQLGVEEKDGIRLAERFVSMVECENIFKRFFETSEVQNIKDYSEVKFK